MNFDPSRPRRLHPASVAPLLLLTALAGCTGDETGSVDVTASRAAAAVKAGEAGGPGTPASKRPARNTLDGGLGLSRPRGGLGAAPTP